MSSLLVEYSTKFQYQTIWFNFNSTYQVDFPRQTMCLVHPCGDIVIVYNFFIFNVYLPNAVSTSHHIAHFFLRCSSACWEIRCHLVKQSNICLCLYIHQRDPLRKIVITICNVVWAEYFGVISNIFGKLILHFWIQYFFGDWKRNGFEILSTKNKMAFKGMNQKEKQSLIMPISI